MLLVLILFLAVSSVALFFLKRDRQTIYLLGLCYSFLCLSIGMTVCLSKVGGLSPEQKSFLFLDTQIQLWLSYRMFPFWKWGYMIVLGWYLFPTFLLLTAMYYSMVPAVLRFRKNSWMVFILPAISLAVSYSAFFPRLAKSGLALPTLLMKLSAVWVYGYMTVAVILLVYEYRDIIMPYNKRQFRYIMVFILCVAVQYMVYGMQGAIPIYRIYSAESMPLNGWLYADFLTDMRGLYLFSLFTLISVLLGVWNLKNYMVADWKKNREETSIYRKSDTARMGVTVFVHSIKNQLLSNRVLCKKIRKELAGEYPDQKKLEEYAHMLEEVNESMLGRMEELYKSTKLNYISLCPMTARQIVDTTLKLFHKKYPEVQVKISGKMEGSLLLSLIHI